MSIGKRSPYGPFLEQVVLPAVRIGALLLAVLAIGFGSWLETNDNASSCSFKSSMSLHQVYLYRNISSNLTTPDSVSFGLWKHCYMYALNCSCTPTNLKYQPDVSTILQVATEHNAIPPLTNTTSLNRIIPLILATIFSCIAFLIGLWANRRGKYIYRKIVFGLIVATSILLAYAFGSTYDQYFRMIKQTCKSLNNNVYCARHAVQIEVVIFAMALILLFIGLIFWFISSAFFTIPTYDDEKQVEQVKHWSFQYNNKRKKKNKGNELAVWRDVTMFDESDQNELWPQKPDNAYDPYNNPQPLPKYLTLTPSPPPPPPPVKESTRGNNHNKSRVTSNKKHLYHQQQQQQKRKDSNDSSSAALKSKRNPTNRPLSELEPTTYKNTPTSISPHPFQYPPITNDSKNSFVMTPTTTTTTTHYDDPNSIQQQQQQQHAVPILNMPPIVEHPLNKKVIKDKRIQTYLQTQT
ncbi:hypothetical protein BD770DRAFT_296732, partial [Pilaira anomala]